MSLLNLGKVRDSRWTCRGCCKRILDAVLDTLDENKHLADGDACTLIRIKRAVYPNGKAEARLPDSVASATKKGNE